MDELLGIDLIDCAGDNLAAIAPMVIFPASADKRVVTRYGEVASASFARPGAATYVEGPGEVGQVGVDAPRVGSTGWILEGSATNVALWSNSFTAEHGHTLNDCTTSVSPTEYLLTDESGAPRYATTLTATANIGRVGRYNISVTAGTPVSWSIHVKAISGKFRFAGYDGSKAVSVLFDCATRTFSGLSDPSSISSQLQYEYIGNGWFRLSVTITPTVTSSTAAASIGLELSGNSGYISGAQFVVGPVVTSYIYTEDVAITRASEGSDTSGNGLSIPLSRAMLDSLTGELSDWTAAWSHVSGTAPTYSGGNKILTYSTQTSTDYHALLPAGVSVGHTVEIGYTITGYSAGSFNFGFGSGQGGVARTANGTYTERGTLTTNTSLYAYSTTLTGTVTINYIRRVLESGQTNPGEGTVLCGIYLPWAAASLPNGTTIPFLSVFNGQASLAYVYGSGVNQTLSTYDYTSVGGLLVNSLSAGRYVVAVRYKATTAQKCIGIYNQATGVLTWSSYATYRGFFPIHSSNRLRFFYGGGAYPIHVRGLRWLNSIGSDAECVRLSKEMLP